MANFIGSLKRNRKQFSDSKATNLAIECAESKEDILRNLTTQIREQLNIINSIEEDSYTDELIGLLKNKPIKDARKEIVQRRFDALLELRNLTIKKKLWGGDAYFDLPKDFEKVAITSVPTSGDDIEDVLVMAGGKVDE